MATLPIARRTRLEGLSYGKEWRGSLLMLRTLSPYLMKREAAILRKSIEKTAPQTDLAAVLLEPAKISKGGLLGSQVSALLELSKDERELHYHAVGHLAAHATKRAQRGARLTLGQCAHRPLEPRLAAALAQLLAQPHDARRAVAPAEPPEVGLA